MKYPVFSIRDRHVGFLTPTVDINELSAKRNFSQAVNHDVGGAMHYEPGDFDLYHIGFFDTESGLLEAFPVPVLVVTGLSVYKEKK